jgi:hypothetical protein
MLGIGNLKLETWMGANRWSKLCKELQMDKDVFADKDLRQIEEHGLTIDEVHRQLDLFKMPKPFLKLGGPCTVGDGIMVFAPEKKTSLLEIYEREGAGYNCVKFVPASGAASRMFKVLLRYLNQEKEITGDEVSMRASAGDGDAKQLLDFMDGLKKFAFFRELKSVLSGQGFNVDTLLETGCFRDILRFLLTDDGLDYANLPKGLLKFHEYPEGSRTAFEEHLVEAASYVADEDGLCPLHLTVSQEHLNGFDSSFKADRPIYEERYGVRYDISFSMQAKSTDTLAVTLDNTPFRQEDGKLLFRPGGHGALLKNLNNIDGDIIFIKNIDNVVPDYLKPETFRWKKITGGYLISTRNQIRGYMKRLASGDIDHQLLAEAAAFLEDKLLLSVPELIKSAPPEAKRTYLMERLDRPVRVCGMVKNRGEPGGGPFWVEDETGERSLQIVETVQIDLDSKEQRDILEASTHFNPVDLVCGVRDWQGRPFDLNRFVDPKAVVISQKSKDGRDLKALEHPGLWNGSMARWITLFVEVPGITFNPVKTVNDLLRKEHQPG